MMSNDSFSEVTTESWFSRIGQSIEGILFGFVLFIGAFPLLWWNERRSVERYNSLQEGLAAVVSVASDAVDSANQGKLVYTIGFANTDETLRDEQFGVSAKALKLTRKVEMYQWQEQVKTETKEEVGETLLVDNARLPSQLADKTLSSTAEGLYIGLLFRNNHLHSQMRLE